MSAKNKKESHSDQEENKDQKHDTGSQASAERSSQSATGNKNDKHSGSSDEKGRYNSGGGGENGSAQSNESSAKQKNSGESNGKSFSRGFRNDGGNGGNSSGRRRNDRDQEGEYSRDWDTLKNEDYGQMTQGSYNPRNNRQAWSRRDSGGQGGDGRRPSRQWDRYSEDDLRSRSRYSDYDHYERRGRLEDGEGIFRGRQWGQTYAQAGRGFADQDGRELRHENRDDAEYRSRSGERQGWRSSREDSSGQRYQGYDSYGSSPENFGTQQFRNREDEPWDLNKRRRYSDYENPSYSEDEYSGPQRYGNRDYDNYGSEFDGPYDTGNRMRRRDFDENPARSRSFSRGYQYGTDGYNSGTNQMDRDYERDGEYRNQRRYEEEHYNDENNENWDSPRMSGDSYGYGEYENPRYGRSPRRGTTQENRRRQGDDARRNRRGRNNW